MVHDPSIWFSILMSDSMDQVSAPFLIQGDEYLMCKISSMSIKSCLDIVLESLIIHVTSYYFVTLPCLSLPHLFTIHLPHHSGRDVSNTNLSLDLFSIPFLFDLDLFTHDNIIPPVPKVPNWPVRPLSLGDVRGKSHLKSESNAFCQSQMWKSESNGFVLIILKARVTVESNLLFNITIGQILHLCMFSIKYLPRLLCLSYVLFVPWSQSSLRSNRPKILIISVVLCTRT